VTWMIDDIALPFDPQSARLQYAAEAKTLGYPGDLAMILSLGRKVDVLTVKGYIADPPKTKSELETTYILPLREKVYREVTISTPDSRFNGKWIFVTFVVDEKPGEIGRFWYEMTFWKGSTHMLV